MYIVREPQIAICQPSIILGGRLRVILGIVEIFNDIGIVPDILTMRLGFDPSQVINKYVRPIRARFRLLPSIPKLSVYTLTVLFNAVIRIYGRSYDLLINSGNSLLFLPGRQRVITYMHFPHKRRIVDVSLSIHRPEADLDQWSRQGIERAILRFIYRFSESKPSHLIVCNSKFTRSALQAVYDLPANPMVVYPPVEVDRFRTVPRSRPLSIITVGRFTPDKRQLEQIRLAERMPHIPFHIVGFANNNPYYQKCRHYVEEHGIGNVHLYPDLPFKSMFSLLQSARYFLHTTINEPFGITTVQAIAAGCLPLVHDSGGQREIVIEPTLRYRSLSEVPTILEKLEEMSEADRLSLVARLQEYITANFDEKVFAERMRAILLKYLREKIVL